MPKDTASPQRNFTIAVDERVRALVSGPPAYMRRLRAIEDLDERIVAALVEAWARAEERGDAAEAAMRAAVPRKLVARRDELVAKHNRFYPIEANLALHPRTGVLVDKKGSPWHPMEPRTIEELVALARARRSA
jgi:hypothetical protein